MDLKNRVAIVTGAGSGIGEATALELSMHGCTCVLLGRTESRLKQVLERVRDHTPDSMVAVCDVSNKTQVKQTVQQVYERYGHIDILVNSAGIMVVKLFADLSDEEFDRHMTINYNGTVYFIRALLPIMRKQSAGVIVNMASVGGKLNLPGLTANTASKAAMYAFSESLYNELKEEGIHVAAILPGGTRTSLFERVYNRLGEYYRDQSTASPSRVAKSIREAIEKERFETVVPLSNKIYIGFHSLFPWLFRKYVMRRIRGYLN
jgi:short-subunit dehydrogenase